MAYLNLSRNLSHLDLVKLGENNPQKAREEFNDNSTPKSTYKTNKTSGTMSNLPQRSLFIKDKNGIGKQILELGLTLTGKVGYLLPNYLLRS